MMAERINLTLDTLNPLNTSYYLRVPHNCPNTSVTKTTTGSMRIHIFPRVSEQGLRGLRTVTVHALNSYRLMFTASLATALWLKHLTAVRERSGRSEAFLCLEQTQCSLNRYSIVVQIGPSVCLFVSFQFFFFCVGWTL